MNQCKTSRFRQSVPIPTDAVIRDQLARSLSLINFIAGADLEKAQLIARSPLMEVALHGAAAVGEGLRK